MPNKPNTIKKQLFIVDDHNLFRDGIKFILSDEEHLEVLAEASNGKEFLDLLQYSVQIWY
ncbi:MAG: response regulator transcription factor [Bacteroidales bacterium]|nr:response regulator transcription factor [Bacteroidales bacterium]